MERLGPGTRPLWAFQRLQNLVRARGPGVLLAGSLPRVRRCCWLCQVPGIPLMLLRRACSCAPVQVMKRGLQSALVWTMYEELQPRLAAAIQSAQPHEEKGAAPEAGQQ